MTVSTPFSERRTDRLLLRPVRPGDAAPLAERRSDPEVARYQNWIPPYPLDRAERMVAETAELDGPTDGEWWMATIADHADHEVFGDVVVHLTWEGRTAEIGYTLAHRAWGHGYAVETTAAMIEFLFVEAGVTRVEAMLHPDNPASAMVLERVGLLFEGHTRSSFWVGDDNSDDWFYGMTRPDWERWRGRPRHGAADVRLIEITAENVVDVQRLRTHRSQQRFVSSVTESLADALVPEVVDGAPLAPWYRAVEADGELVGFVMLAEPTDAHPEPYLWRLLVDRLHQRRGLGSTVIDLVVDQARSWNATSLLVSWCQGKGSPEPMYLARGFVPTGRIVDGEIEARLPLT